MKEKITIRNATSEDLPAIVEIYNSSIPSREATADTDPVSLESKKEWFYLHNPKTRPLWILEKKIRSSPGSVFPISRTDLLIRKLWRYPFMFRRNSREKATVNC